MADLVAIGVGGPSCRWASTALPSTTTVIDAMGQAPASAISDVGDDAAAVVVLPDPRGLEPSEDVPDYLALIRACESRADRVFVVFLSEAESQPATVARRLARFATTQIAAYSTTEPSTPASGAPDASLLPMINRMASRFGGVAAVWQGDSDDASDHGLTIDGLVGSGWLQSGPLESMQRPKRAPRPSPRKGKLVQRNPKLRRRLEKASQAGAEAIAPALGEVETFCQFLGYPRSGSTIVGALLDAHPEIVISHELDLNRYVELGFGRTQLLWLMVKRSMTFAELQRTRGKYQYDVPGQWQGRFRSLRVVGDKQAGITTQAFGLRPGLLDKVRSEMGGRAAYIHVVRNPFDNITTDFTRISAKSETATLENSIERYFGLVDTVMDLKSQIADGDFHEVHHEDFVADPKRLLTRLAGFLGVEAEPDWLDATAAIVNPAPSRSRDKVDWPAAAVAGVHARIDRHEHLRRYDFSN